MARKIKLFPVPHVELCIHASDEMVKDLRECQRLAKLQGDGKDCQTCSWREVEIENTGLCEWPGVIEKILEES